MRERDGRVVAVGYAGSADGTGLAYAVPSEGSEAGVLRVPFTYRPMPALQGREVSYAALNAVAAKMLERDARDVVLQVADERIVDDLEQRLNVPPPLALPYVRLRCGLNRLGDARIVLGARARCRDLEARARAEVSLDIAA